MLPDVLERDLRLKLQELNEARDIEFTILTINRIADYDHRGGIEPFATGLFNTWGIGNATRNDGILFLISRLDRKFRIELGAGYGTSFNAEMAYIGNTVVTPAFRDMAYYAGIDGAVDKIIYTVTGRYPGEYDATGVVHVYNSTVRFIKRAFWLIVTLGSPFALYFGIKARRHWKRTKPRICSYDGSKMYWMTEADEDAYLQDGQIFEEDIKSIDHDVWGCRECDNIRIEAYPSWRSSYRQCTNCKYKAQTVTKRTLTNATYTSSGTGRASHKCEFCKHTYTKEYSIPMKQKSSSSSSSRSRSSSSFGGGRSSGGGASGSW